MKVYLLTRRLNMKFRDYIETDLAKLCYKYIFDENLVKNVFCFKIKNHSGVHEYNAACAKLFGGNIACLLKSNHDGEHRYHKWKFPPFNLNGDRYLIVKERVYR